MKSVSLLFLVCLAGLAHGQTKDSLFFKTNIPPGVHVSIHPDSGSMGFPRNYGSRAVFTYKDASVYYYVFPYQAADSTAFREAEEAYWVVSGCNVVPHTEYSKNFSSFIIDHRYFLLQRCACRTVEQDACAELAQRMYQWKQSPPAHSR